MRKNFTIAITLSPNTSLNIITPDITEVTGDNTVDNEAIAYLFLVNYLLRMLDTE